MLRRVLPLPNLSDYDVHPVLNVMRSGSGTALGKKIFAIRRPFLIGLQ